MLGFLLRLLPFWVREPLLIAGGTVLGVRLVYLAVREPDLATAGFGALFLVFTAVRVHTVVRALRARRKPGPAVASGGAVVDEPAQVQPQAQVPAAAAAPAPAPAPAATLPGPASPEKEHNAWGQAIAAFAVFGVLALAVWAGPRFMPANDNTPKPASCSDGEQEELPKAFMRTPKPVTGDQLCEALNRPGLAKALGTPGEIAISASGTDNTAPLTDGKVALPEATVTFDTYTVNVSATYNHLTVDQYVKLMKYGSETDVKSLHVLGRPAVLSSDHTMKIEIDLGSGGSGGPVEQGPLARTLTVALDREDRGGYCDISVYSASGALPDDSVLLTLAERVLPKIPELPAR
ncbi:DUF6215 domain-containing protein [Streptomyces sp. NPDC004082]